MSCLMTLIQAPNGDVMLVRSLEGHEDCKILEENVSEPRVPGCERVPKADGKGKRWKINKDESRRMIRAAQLRAMDRIDLVELIEGRLDPLEARVEALEQRFTESSEKGKGEG